MSDSAATIIATLEGRARFYDLLAALCFKPLKQETIDNLANQDLEQFAGLNSTFDEGIHDITRYLAKRNTGTREQLAVDFTSVFVGTKTYEGKSAVPYESVFTSPDGLMCQESFHEVRAIFRRASFKTSDKNFIPDDHLGYACEFMSMLSIRAIDRLKDGDSTAAVGDLELSKEFLNTHILNWYDAYAERANALFQTRFYRGFLKMAKGYFESDRELVQDLIDESRNLS